jgi:hypothetical protein
VIQSRSPRRARASFGSEVDALGVASEGVSRRSLKPLTIDREPLEDPFGVHPPLQDLDRDRPGEGAQLACPVDLGEPAFADLVLQLVTRDVRELGQATQGAGATSRRGPDRPGATPIDRASRRRQLRFQASCGSAFAAISRRPRLVFVDHRRAPAPVHTCSTPEVRKPRVKRLRSALTATLPRASSGATASPVKNPINYR